MYAVTYIAKFAQNPGRKHWYAWEQILTYLKGTIDYGIVYEHDHDDIGLEGHYHKYKSVQQPSISFHPKETVDQLLQGMTDASHADDPDNCKSTTGYIFRMANGPIAWQTKLQESVTLSTMESEYVAACAAT